MPYRKPAATPELDFDSLWNYAGEWFEAPNRHRQGWSGVNRILCRDADGKGPFYAFLKRQHNFMRRTWRHPWHGVSTFYCEYQNLLHLSRRGVPVPAPLFFSEKKKGTTSMPCCSRPNWSAFLRWIGSLPGFSMLTPVLQSNENS